MKILVVKLSALGDVAQALAVLPTLKAGIPHASLYWLVEEASSDLLKGHPLLERVFICRRKNWLKAIKKAINVSSVFREMQIFLRDLRSEYFDIVLDLQGLFKSGLLVALARAKRKIGFANHREGSTIPLTQKLPPYDPDRHAVFRYLDAAEYIGGQRPEEITFPLPHLPPPSQLLRKFSIEGNFAVFIPCARWETKLWSIDAWVNLAHKVYRFFGMQILFIGSQNDKAYVSRIISQAPFAKSLCGKTSILSLAGLLKASSLIVTVDTGPMHLAVTVGKRVVAIFGPTAPWRTGPFGKGHRIVRSGLPCSPCFRKRCNHLSCMKTILPEQVFQQVEELMANGGS